MPQPPLSPDLAIAALDAVAQHGGISVAARALNMPTNTLRNRIAAANRMMENGTLDPGRAPLPASEAPTPPREFDRTDLPDELPTAEELIARREKQFQRKRAAKEARRLIPVAINIDGPFGVCHMGDPHVDDDGTDLAKLRSHLDICNQTEGLFAACVGDYSNNWVGRLARLYGEQSLSAAEAWVLVEWLIHSTEWLYLIGGNHDCWSGAGDPIQWIAKHKGQQYEHNGARLELQTPSKRTFRVSARHEFVGHSMYNAAHGPAKAALTGHRDHVLTCGHQHISGYNVLKDPQTGLITHALRVASYKTYDRYADEKGLRDQNIFVAPVTIFDPRFADDDVRAVTTIFDPHAAAGYLTWLRAQWARGGQAA
jgi:hypothetical protein